MAIDFKPLIASSGFFMQKYFFYFFYFFYFLHFVLIKVLHLCNKTIKTKQMTNTERHEELLQTLAAVYISAQQGKPLTPEMIAHVKHILTICKIKQND